MSASFTSFSNWQVIKLRASCLSNSEHLRAAYWACSLSSRLAILHGYALRVLHFSFRPAFDTIRLH